jgi:nitrate/nitrite transporter NarK
VKEIWQLVVVTLCIIVLGGIFASAVIFVNKIWEHINTGHTYNFSGSAEIKIENMNGNITDFKKENIK